MQNHSNVPRFNLQPEIGHLNSHEKLALPMANGCEFVNIRMIIRCEAHEHFTKIILQGVPHPKVICRPLRFYESILCSGMNFIRTHRSHIINPLHAVAYRKGKTGFVEMSDGVEVPVTKQRQAELLSWFPGI